VFQRPNPFPKTIFDNVAYGPRMNGLARERDVPERVERALRQAALWDEVKDRLPTLGTKLSGGQQQRLTIARALSHGPEILCLDEFSIAIDPVTTMRIEDVLKELRKENTIILVTNLVQQARRLANRTMFLWNGEVVEVGPNDVVFSDNKKVSAKLVGRDPFTDIAVMQVAAQGLKAATLANSDNVPVGALTVAIGSPLGEFQNTVTHGIVSAKGRRVAETSQVILEDLIQTDAPINPGNSGGPLLWAATHQVIGVNTLGVTQATGINFAVSSNTVKQIADEIIANGKVVRGYIGIQYSPLTPRQAAQLGLPSGTIGIVVNQVVAGSPAEQAGIQPNDIITKVNDQVVDAGHPLSSLLIKNRPGDKVKLTLIRAGKEMTVDVTLGQPPQ